MEFDIKKVYTAVNAEDLKKGDKVICADDLAMLKDLVEQGREGGTITNILDRNAFRFMTNTGEIAAFAYLVERAAEENWRPYKDINELISAWQKKTGITARPNTMPLIWVRNKIYSGIACITCFYTERSELAISGCICALEHMFKDYEFLDGSPCGVKE